MRGTDDDLQRQVKKLSVVEQRVLLEKERLVFIQMRRTAQTELAAMKADLQGRRSSYDQRHKKLLTDNDTMTAVKKGRESGTAIEMCKLAWEAHEAAWVELRKYGPTEACKKQFDTTAEQCVAAAQLCREEEDKLKALAAFVSKESTELRQQKKEIYARHQDLSHAENELFPALMAATAEIIRDLDAQLAALDPKT
jgi:hypothetical protein